MIIDHKQPLPSCSATTPSFDFSRPVDQQIPRSLNSLSLNIQQRLYIFIISLFIAVASFSSVSAESTQPPLSVHFIDIGQGDAALLVGPTGKTVLVDSGPSRSWGALKAYLDQLEITHIDLLVNSHPHADHIGNAARVIKRYGIKAVLDSGFVHPIRAYSAMLETVQNHKVKLLLARKGRKINMGGGAQLHILGPEDPFISNSRSDPNSNSVIFRLTYGSQAALFTGDAEEETERRLLADPKTLRADLLKVAHHGSKHASGHAFLDATRPRHAVISCSERNRYGHPAPETLAALRRFNTRPWVTANIGSVIATTTGAHWKLKRVADQGTSKQDDEPKTNQHQITLAQTQGLNPRAAQTLTTQTINGDQRTARNTDEVTTAQDPAKINVNTADHSTLMSLPRVGKTLATRIIKARVETPFSSVDDLRERVRGIGAKSADTLAPLISF